MCCQMQRGSRVRVTGSAAGPKTGLRSVGAGDTYLGAVVSWFGADGLLCRRLRVRCWWLFPRAVSQGQGRDRFTSRKHCGCRALLNTVTTHCPARVHAVPHSEVMGSRMLASGLGGVRPWSRRPAGKLVCKKVLPHWQWVSTVCQCTTGILLASRRALKGRTDRRAHRQCNHGPETELVKQ
jgi:hypothetical protein